MPSKQLIQALAVTTELCGRELSEAAARVFLSDLSGYPELMVIKALERCRKEVKGYLTPADVISRLDDGRPGPEEAWARIKWDERDTMVMSDEMSKAFSVALPLVIEGEMTAARMAFKETYAASVREARDAKIPPRWMVSVGHDPHGREAPILEAIAQGLITQDDAKEAFPMLDYKSDMQLDLSKAVKRIEND